ncbi:MAG TPA: glycosyltransferase family 39 protein, partial [Bacteroidales bacterium]|nr:glycosyltransferase family 39 protein [Bacteroidales bacterium]
MNKSGILKRWSSKIEFWIFIFFLIRLIGITNPPLEISHNWRQVTGLMVARNFSEVDPDILHPRIDDFNGASDIIAMEFPSLNYIHFLFSELFGYSHWYGRLINLIVSSFGLLFFYKLIKLSGISERIAFFATIALSASIWFSFSRKMMPDTYCISLMFIGLYYGLRFLHNQKYIHLILFAVFSSLALLSKIPAGIYLVILLPFVFSRKFERKNRIAISVVTAIPLILAYW